MNVSRLVKQFFSACVCWFARWSSWQTSFRLGAFSGTMQQSDRGFLTRCSLPHSLAVTGYMESQRPLGVTEWLYLESKLLIGKEAW